MPINAADGYSAQFSQFVRFAEQEAKPTESKSIARLDQSGGSLATRTITAGTDDKAYAFRRSSESKEANNAVRDLFKDAVAEMFGGESRIPESVRKAMEMKDYGCGKPLTARRIMAVKAAVDAYNTAGAVDFFAKRSNDALAARFGYTQAEKLKINRVANLYMAACPGISEDLVLLEVMTPGRKANRLMEYGGRFLADAKSFSQGLKLLDDFATWHADLNSQVKITGHKTSLTAINQHGDLGSKPYGLERVVFEELASNRSISLSGTPEEVFGMKNNPAMRFFGRDFAAGRTFTFIQMTPEQRALFFRCTDLLLPITESGNAAAKSVGAPTVARLLRHFDELKRLQAKGQLTKETVWATCFQDARPHPPQGNPGVAIVSHMMNLDDQAKAHVNWTEEAPPTPEQFSRYSALNEFIAGKGYTFEEACDFAERGEEPPPPKLEVPFTTKLGAIADPQVTLSGLTLDLCRPGSYSRISDPTRAGLMPNPRFIVNIPGAQPLEFPAMSKSDSRYVAKMSTLSTRLQSLCGQAHPRQLNAVYCALSQSALMHLRKGIPALGIFCDEHSAVNYTLSRNDVSGAITVRYDSPSGCPITFNWSATINIDGHVTMTPIQLSDQPTP